MIKLSPRDPEYPPRLRRLARPPDPLWVWGQLPDPQDPTVGIVGTRRLTQYGQRIARELAMALARAGAVVVSGLAQGVDSVAHSAALEAAGRTIAVLGEGLAYYDEHGAARRRQLAMRIRKQGALISEWALDVRGIEWTYPRRNLTLAALSDALIVVEAPEGSGALITADRMRRDIRRPVFIVPGPLGASTWEGSNRYIAEGKGTLLASAQQVASYLGLTVAAMPRASGNGAGERLLALLASGPADADTITAGLGLDGPKATTLIAEQVIAGAIAPTPDGRFARVR
ncbi:MAG: DNA-protecting protein DprA [Chloroflexi bacterium]|nr:DNA-protecting protein DprA [Chloroflexota bacterium]